MNPTLLNGLGAKRYGTGIGTGVSMAVMFSPQPGDDPMVIIAKLILIAAGPIASIIGDSIEKYAKANTNPSFPAGTVRLARIHCLSSGLFQLLTCHHW